MRFAWIAVTPDGRAAPLAWDGVVERGPEISFRATRKVVVDVSDKEGRPCPGVEVKVAGRRNVPQVVGFATTDAAEFEVIRQDLLLSIMDIIERAGTSVAVPMRALRIEGDGGRGEATVRSRDGRAIGRVDEPGVTPTVADR